MHMDSITGSFTSETELAAGRRPERGGGALDRQAEVEQLQAQVARLMGEVRELRSEAERLRADRGRMAETQARLMEVLGSKSPDKLLHDLRNVLNERELYRALADSAM